MTEEIRKMLGEINEKLEELLALKRAFGELSKSGVGRRGGGEDS